MSSQALNPSAVCPPVGLYSQAILTVGAGRWLHISGQIGVRPDGKLAEGFSEQADVAWSNVQAILRAADMDVADLVKVVTYLTDVDNMPAFGPVRTKYLGDARPASTLVIVKSLARPDWFVEIEAVAFKP